MTSRFEIKTQWGSSDGGTAEERASIGDLTMVLDEETLTRVNDTWSAAVSPSVRVAAYPLALWFATSWWRLRWESSRGETLKWRADTDWKMSHEVPAVGGGYVWPSIRFDSDGEGIIISSFARKRAASEPVEYLTTTSGRVTAAEFESAVDDFVDRVLARLEQQGQPNTTLHEVWQQVRSQRADAEASRELRIEAQLGFDSGNADAGIIKQFLQLQAQAGEQAGLELAAAFAGEDVARRLGVLSTIASSKGIQAKICMLAVDDPGPAPTPWDRGRALAHAFRRALGNPTGPISDELLSSALELAPGVLRAGPASLRSAPGLGIRDTEDRRLLTLHFTKPKETGRRFEAARFMVDAFTASRGDRWLPLTEAKTARQRLQRAFAAEFLVPIEEIEGELAGDYSEDGCQALAEKYVVSDWTVQSQLANHGLISHSAVPS